MPEIKHDFSAGKMNKDLDERIVQNGEYRDAMNIQVRTTDSEGGGVGNAGSVQNIKGNKRIKESAHYETGYIDARNESKIIASVSNEKNNTAYFFLSSPDWPVFGKFNTGIVNAINNSTERKKYIDTIIEINTGVGTDDPVSAPVVVDFWGFIDKAFRVLDYDSGGQANQSIIVQPSDDYRVGMLVQAYDNDGSALLTQGAAGMGGVEIQEIIDNGDTYELVLYESQGGAKLQADASFFTFRHPKRILNFTNDTKVTGINIIDDLLFWTDNLTEPKKVNIKRGKAGSIAGSFLVNADWTRHTQLKLHHPIDKDDLLDFTNDLEVSLSPSINNDLKEEHVTVLRRAPLMAPTLKMSRTDRESEITTVLGFFYDFAILNEGTGPEVGELITIPSTDENTAALNASYPLDDVDWRVGDILKFRSQNGEWLTASVAAVNYVDCSSTTADYDGDGVVNSEDDDCNDGQVYLDINVLTISGNYEIVNYNVDPTGNSMTTDDVTGYWTITLSQRNPLFELKMGRFGCRYKYEDGEYSSFGPWSEVAFLPGAFDYDHRKGYNLGMTNTIREITIKDFIPHQRVKQNDVVAVDILYKTTDNANVYVVKTITRGVDNEWKLFTTSSPEAVSSDYMFGELSITTEMIHKVLPETQLMRSWDNVPKKSLGQEIAANRLVYSNYEQGYDLENQLGLIQTVLSDPTANILEPKKSIKSIRDYKIGMVFGDEYGRETPVIAPAHLAENDQGVKTIIDGSVSVDKRYASSRNYFSILQDWTNGNQGPDDWISYVKYYVKETSSEYYNLVMDKWYNAEDGNIWLSFNSADRNKLDEDTYLILKNEHGGPNAVEEKARYKIIAIENEAPEFIKADPRNMGMRRLSGNGGNEDNSTQDSYSFIWMFPEPQDDSPSTTKPFLLMEDREMKIYNLDYDNFLEEYADVQKGDLQVRIIGQQGEGPSATILKGNKWETVTWWKHMDSTSGPEWADVHIRWANPFGEQADMLTRFQNLTGAEYIPDLSYWMEFREMIVVDKAEFDGKFFVKIEKDDLLDSKVLQFTDAITNWDMDFGMQVAYIDNQQYNPGATGCEFCDDEEGSNQKRRNYKWLNGGDNGDTTGHTGSLSSAGTPGDNLDGSVVVSIGNLWSDDYDCPASYREYDAGEVNDSQYNLIDSVDYDGELTDSFDGDVIESGSGTFNAANKTSGCFSYDAKYLGLGCGDYDGVSGGAVPYEEVLAGGYNSETFGTEIAVMDSVLDFIENGYNEPTFQDNEWLTEPVGDYGGVNSSTNIINRARESKDFWKWWQVEATSDLKTRIFIDGARTAYTTMIQRGSEDDWICDDGFSETGGCLGDSENGLGDDGNGPNGQYPGRYYKATGLDEGHLTKYQLGGDGDLEYGPTREGANGRHLGRIFLSVHSINQTGGGAQDPYKEGWGEPGDPEYTFKSRMTMEGQLFRFENDPQEPKPIYQIIGTINDVDFATMYNYNEIERSPDSNTFDWELVGPWAWNDLNLNNFGFSGAPCDQNNYQFEVEGINYLYDTEEGFNINAGIPSTSGIGGNYPFIWLNPGCPYIGRREEWNHLDFSNHNPFHHNPGTDDSGMNNDQFVRVGGLYGHMLTDIDQPKWWKNAKWDHAICAPCSTMYGRSRLNYPSFGNWQDTQFDNFFDFMTNVEGFGTGSDQDSSPYCQRQGFRVEFRRYDPENLKLLGEGPDQGTHGIDTSVWDPRGSICHDGREALRITLIRKSESAAGEIVVPTSNAAIWETEPKENVELDIYYEASNAIPVRLNSENTANFAPYGSKVTIREWNGVSYVPETIQNTNHHVSHIGYTQTYSIVGVKATDSTGETILQTTDISVGDYMVFTHPDGTNTMSKVVMHMQPVDSNGNNITPSNTAENVFEEVGTSSGDATGYYKLDSDVWKFPVELGWHNCWSFGNGVESDRIRDDFNAPQMDNGVKVSTTFLDYGKERRGSGMIYSGLYNSTAGINDLNEFNMAEKITKDINPSYGSIQRLKTRDTDVVVLTEDKVLKVTTNKDALYNADGNPQLMASNRVLGTAVPFSGDYGISNNPESLAWDQFRLYFTDMQRGAVMRLSRDGLTPISDVGMRTWFRDNLKKTDSLLGTFDMVNGEYNLTLGYNDNYERSITASFNEKSKGWVSFKSFIPQAGESVGGKYLTAISKSIRSSAYDIKKGIFEHYVDITKSDPNASNFGEVINRNVFYAQDTTIQCENSDIETCEDIPQVDNYFTESRLAVLFNENHSSVKSFKAINYEGSQARINKFTNSSSNQLAPDGSSFGNQSDGEYYNLKDKKGWYVDDIVTDLSFEGSVPEFIGKEGKWFNRIGGVVRRQMTIQDLSEFSVQGLGMGTLAQDPSISTEDVDDEITIIPDRVEPIRDLDVINVTPDRDRPPADPITLVPDTVTINIKSDMIDDTSNPYDPLADNNE